MVPVTEPGNFILLMILWITLGIPLTVIAFGFFLLVRRIPARTARFLVPLALGIIVAAWYSVMDPSNPGDFGLLLFIGGALIHPLLILPPITLMPEYLQRIPAGKAVFLASFISLCLILSWGALQGDGTYIADKTPVWDFAMQVITDLIIASVIAGIIIGTDRIMAGEVVDNAT